MIESATTPPTIDLTNCDREPIHIPGSILPHGAMLVLDCSTLRITQIAGATETLLGITQAELLGQTADHIFNPEQVDRLRKLAAMPNLVKPLHLLDPALRVQASMPLDASAHQSDGVLIVEFEAADLTDRFASDPLAAVLDMVSGFGSASTLQAFCLLATEQIRAVATYDRVMIYRFLNDGSGWVIAESRRPDLVPFLDLHYLAADIPKQARALYLKSWLRLITQVNYEPALLQPACNPLTGRPLDMSYAILRDVSPIHREYLRNMGIDASMSISIIHDGALWGLIACHHYSPHNLPRHLRAVCELFGSMFSLQLAARKKDEQFATRLASRKILQELMLNLSGIDDYAAGLTQQSPNLLDYIHGGDPSQLGSSRAGVAVYVSGKLTSLGNTPTHEQIIQLTAWLAVHTPASDGIFQTDRLGEIWPPAQEFSEIASGILAISVSHDPSDFILWFRPELVETSSWAGDPTKPVISGPDGDRLSPRTSFAAWKQTVRGRALPWTQADYDAAFDLRVSLLQVVLRRIDAANHERMKAYERDQLLMAELDHRVKNTLANIQALVSQTSRSADSLSSFVKGLDGRIHSMAKAHSLLTQSRWEGASITGLLNEELNPYGMSGSVVSLDGPNVMLTPKSALALSLAIHELVTNAAKYGALCNHGGRVAVKWHLAAERGIVLSWSETEGPIVQPPIRRGFGSRLIEQALAMETGGYAMIRYEPSGVLCDIVLPPSSIVAIVDSEDKMQPQPEQPSLTVESFAHRKRILLVEDSSLIIMALEQMIEDMGWDIVGPATRLAEGVALANTESIDIAMLDVNLNGDMSWAIATILKQRGIPFMFTTGYNNNVVLPAHLAGSLVINKPFSLDEISQKLTLMVGVGSTR